MGLEDCKKIVTGNPRFYWEISKGVKRSSAHWNCSFDGKGGMGVWKLMRSTWRPEGQWFE